MTWKFPFSSGVPIDYCLRNCLMIGWFKCLQYLQVNLGTRGFHLIVTRCPVISLVSCDWSHDQSCDFCWRFYDVVIRISWLNNEFWLDAASFFNLFWLFQGCGLFSKPVFCITIKLLQATCL